MDPKIEIKVSFSFGEQNNQKRSKNKTKEKEDEELSKALNIVFERMREKFEDFLK